MEQSKIRIVWIPNQLSKEGRVEAFLPFVNGKLLWEYLLDLEAETLQSLPKEGLSFLSASAGKIDPLTHVPQADDEILIMREVKDPFTIGAVILASLGASIATVAAWATVVGWVAILATLAVVGYSIYSAFQKPRRPNFGTTGGAGGGSLEDSSPTYAWDGIRTIQDVGVPVAIIYGQHKVGGNIINQYTYSDGEKEYLNLLIALGEGEIDSIGSIKINDNPFENYTGLTKYERYGTNDQAVIQGFEELHNIYDIGANLLKDAPYTQTTIDNDVEALEVEVSFPYGIYEIQGGGDLVDYTVTYKIAYKIHTDVTWTELTEITVTNKSRTAQRRKTKITGLTPGQYDVKVTRTSDDSTSMKIGDMKFNRLDEIKNDDLAYPNTALLGMKLLATDQMSGVTPTVSCIVKGLKIKTYKIMNGETEVPYADYYYDPATASFKLLADDTVLTWDGVTYSTAWTENPAWCFYDLIVNNRYGIGEFISAANIDLATFVEMAKHCDERVAKDDSTFEKRFTMDVVIDSTHTAIDIMVQLCATFRAWAFYSQGTIKLKIDKPESPVQLFGMGNIIAGSLQQAWKSVKDVPNVIEVQFLDANKDYEQETVAKADELSLEVNPMRKKQLRIFTTSLTRALREGRYALNLARYIHRSITFKASIDAVACQAGDVVSVAHDLPAWGSSGRVVSASDWGVVLDKEVTIVAGTSYKIRCRMADDTLEEKTVVNEAGTYTALTISSKWTKNPVVGDIWAFGENNVLKKDFRIVNVKREGNSDVAFECTEYSALVYDDTAPITPEDNFVDIDSGIPSVTDLLCTERVVVLPDGTVKTVLDVWWNKPDASGLPFKIYNNAKIYVSREGGGYELKGSTDGTYFTIEDGIVVGYTYRVKVTTVTTLGQEKSIDNSPYFDISITGKTDPPSSITAFVCNQRRDTLVFGWTEVSDTDLLGYEIRKGTSWASGAIVATGLTGGQYTSNSVGSIGDEESYWIKAIDTSGNYSTTAKEAVVVIDNVPFSNIVMTWLEENEVDLTWQSLGEDTFQTDQDLTFSSDAWIGTKENMEVSGTNLIFSTGQVTGKYTAKIRDVGYIAPFRIGITPVFTAVGDEAFNTVGEATFQDSETMRWSGDEVSVNCSVRIRTSEDNLTWGEWEAWRDVDYYCRYFQLEFTFTRATSDLNVQCSSIKTVADLPDVDEFGGGEVLVAGDGCEIVFEKTFHEDPAVSISILTGLGTYFSFTVAPTTTGFTVKLYKRDGTPTTGMFSYHAHGI